MTSTTLKLKKFIESHGDVYNIIALDNAVQFSTMCIKCEGGKVVEQGFDHHTVRSISEARFALGY